MWKCFDLRARLDDNGDVRQQSLVVCVFLTFGASAYAQTPLTAAISGHKGTVTMTRRASGTFEVKMTPQAPDEKADPGLSRMSIDKQFHGDLAGTSKGHMLAAGSGAKGSSAGYVALERVTGTLDGKSGTFVLQHSGSMTRGTPELSVTVVPDSGTGELVGLSGKMIINSDGKHSYDFDYTLAPAP